jgi:hypothetical protein
MPGTNVLQVGCPSGQAQKARPALGSEDRGRIPALRAARDVGEGRFDDLGFAQAAI